MRLRRSRDAGFTLVEVLVALGIAGGALVLVLSANNASLKRSREAREDLRTVRSAESKYEECVLGIERALAGELEGLPGWRWEVFRTPRHVVGLKRLHEVRFVVYRPEGGKVFEWGGLREAD